MTFQETHTQRQQPRLNYSGQPPLPDPGRSSIFRGVHFDHGRWQARITVNGKQVYLGRFTSEVDAARAFDRQAKEVYESPVLNFLPDGTLNPERKKRQRRVPAVAAPSAAAATAPAVAPPAAAAVAEDDDEADLVTVGIQDEDEQAGEEEQRPGKRARLDGAAVKEEEDDMRTVAIKEKG